MIHPAAWPGPAPSRLQVHLRLQWKTEAVRGQSTKLEVDMAGLSLVVMGGLQVRPRAGKSLDCCSSCCCWGKPDGLAPACPRDVPPSPTKPKPAPLQDELFNLTTDQIKASAVSSRLDLQVGAG